MSQKLLLLLHVVISLAFCWIILFVLPTPSMNRRIIIVIFVAAAATGNFYRRYKRIKSNR